MITVQGAVDTAKVGTYTIEYTATDFQGNQHSETRTVYVIDLVSPVINAGANDTLNREVFSAIGNIGVTASDNYYSAVSLTIDSSLVNKAQVGIYTVRITATDSSGNTAIAQRYIRVRDTQAPVIHLLGVDTLTILVNSTYIEKGAVVTDNYCHDLDWQVSGTVNTAITGLYTLEYTADDCQGNTAAPVKRLVKVSNTLSVKDMAANAALTIYPNPSQGRFTVNLGQDISQSVQVKMLDMLGRVVYHTDQLADNGKLTIEAPALATGIYYLQVVLPGGTAQTGKVQITE